MHEYEIRILGSRPADTVLEVVHLNDHAAVRAARKLAEGRNFEVWRGFDCIYAGAGETKPTVFPPASDD